MLAFSSVFQVHKYCLGCGEGGLKHPSLVFQIQKKRQGLIPSKFFVCKPRTPNYNTLTTLFIGHNLPISFFFF